MDEQRIKQLFPRASQSFLEANPGLCAKEPEPNRVPTLEGEALGETKSDARPVLSIVMYRVRLLDKENAYGATKSLTDCLCEVGLISGDSESQIDLTVSQEKVSHYKDQQTELTIVYP